MSLNLTGSVEILGSVSSSLFGTASWAKNTISGSHALVANSASFAVSASWAPSSPSVSASYAATSSLAERAIQIDVYVKNVTGAQINKGKVVRIYDATGDNPLIGLASNTNEAQSANSLGITTTNIPNDSFGFIITSGILIGINTDAFSAGDLLYLGASGSIVNTPSIAPLHTVRLGEVLRVQQNNGSMYVSIDNGSELGELHNVKDSGSVSGDLLVKSGSIWINSKSLSGSYQLTGSLSVAQTVTIGNLQLNGIGSFPDDIQAAAGGVPLNGVYKSGNVLLIRVS